MLVGALQVEVCRRRQALALSEHASVSYARVEPYVEGVHDLFVRIGLFA